jgi:methyl-accepting chemotaxis protein
LNGAFKYLQILPITRPYQTAIGTMSTTTAPLKTPAFNPTTRPGADSGSSGFFKHHGLWAPGVRLFRRIGFRSKAMVISAFFVVPILVLSLSYFGDKATSIEFSSKERVGIAYGQEILPLIDLLQRQRLAAALAAVQAPQASATSGLDSAVNAQMTKLDAVERAHGAYLNTQAAHSKFKAAKIELPASGADLNQTMVAHSARLQALVDLLGVSTDGSNLTLDPDIDTYYLMDAVYFRLPQMVESVGQLSGLGAAVLHSANTDLRNRRILIEQYAATASNLAALEAGLAKAMAYNGQVKAATEAGQALAEVHKFLKQVDETVLRPEGMQGAAPEHVAGAARAIESMLSLSQRATAKLDTLVAARVEGMNSSRNLTALTLLVSLSVVVYLFAAFQKVLEGGLKEVALHINAMRDGNLTTSPRAWGADEAASLMNTLVQMQESLRRIVNQVRLTSDNIVRSSTEIAAGSLDLSARTEQAAANLEESASAMEQISTTVKHTADTVDQAAHLARSNAVAAEEGGRVVNSMIATMDNIQSSSRKIGDIVGTIDGIAFQTNILALNAAVEAARAGDAGRGFAVVATEVRLLAQRSASAAREIKTLIGSSVESVEAGTSVVKQVGSTIGDIVEHSNRVNHLLGEIAKGAREQSAGVAQTTQAVQDMDTATQQNASLVEQTAAAANSLKGQAGALAAEVASFKLV